MKTDDGITFIVEVNGVEQEGRYEAISGCRFSEGTRLNLAIGDVVKVNIYQFEETYDTAKQVGFVEGKVTENGFEMLDTKNATVKAKMEVKHQRLKGK